MSASLDSSDSVAFSRVVADEIAQINRRREWLRQQGLSARPDAAPAPDGKVNEVVGLALSGGGIRSAATCLGVMQALNHHGLLNHVDYLSTVSGGGYIGASVTATMAKTGRFVFGAEPPANDRTEPLPAEISDTPAVGHIRNYSNYLIPNGLRDALTATAIIVRGLITNIALVLPIVLLLAALTIAANPNRTSLEQSDFFGYDLSAYLANKFGITLIIALVGVALFFLWAVYRSLLRNPARLAEFRGWLPTLGASWLVLLVAAGFIEFQPFVVDGMFQIADAAAGHGGLVTGLFTSWLQTLAAIAAPVAAAVMFFQRQFGGILKADNAASDLATRIFAQLIKVAIWIAGAALPLLVWIAYLYLCYWGIINNRKYPPPVPCDRAAISASVQVEAKGARYSSSYRGPDRNDACDEAPKPVGEGTHTPRWLIGIATAANEALWGSVPPKKAEGSAANPSDRFDLHLLYYRPLTTFYLLAGFALFMISRLLSPNANSLHRLYRDRLGKAFLFNPDSTRTAAGPQRNEASIDQGRDFEQLNLPLTALASERAPYHLINTALNIQGSDFANRRGRNADFFLASPLYVGSEATGYQPTSEFQEIAPAFDVATAVAISGAAASSNMGSNSIQALTATLALLNVRMGYWLKNPKYLAYWRRMAANAFAPEEESARGAGRKRVIIPSNWLRAYLFSEITGRLYENSDEIYLTDGGHIENLGIYELLRRRCRLIIAVDAEGDAAMRFGSLVTLQRYARIDHGILIHLPWLPIQERTVAHMRSNAGKASSPASGPSTGPHIAIGTIDYGGGETGYLVYIKSSLTGDENDYIRDYARRYDRFPHESTGDQFFSEEQFEVYRALGFHMLHGVLCGRDDVVATADAALPASTKFTNSEVASIRQVREALGLSSAP